MESSLVKIYKDQYDKASVLLEFSTMSLGKWCLNFQVRGVLIFQCQNANEEWTEGTLILSWVIQPSTLCIKRTTKLSTLEWYIFDTELEQILSLWIVNRDLIISAHMLLDINTSSWYVPEEENNNEGS